MPVSVSVLVSVLVGARCLETHDCVVIFVRVGFRFQKLISVLGNRKNETDTEGSEFPPQKLFFIGDFWKHPTSRNLSDLKMKTPRNGSC